MAQKRILKELKDNAHSDSDHAILRLVGGNLFHMHAIIEGPQESIYQEGVFHLNLVFPADYPFKPPRVNFITKVYHPNIYKNNGAVCMDILRDAWCPALTTSRILLSIRSLLADPNFDEPLDTYMVDQHKRDPEGYEATVKKWIQCYANITGQIDAILHKDIMDGLANLKRKRFEESGHFDNNAQTEEELEIAQELSMA